MSAQVHALKAATPRAAQQPDAPRPAVAIHGQAAHAPRSAAAQTHADPAARPTQLVPPVAQHFAPAPFKVFTARDLDRIP